MPVEIRELVITTTISTDNSRNTNTAQPTTVDTEKIIKACVEQVMEIIKEKEQR